MPQPISRADRIDVGRVAVKISSRVLKSTNHSFRPPVLVALAYLLSQYDRFEYNEDEEEEAEEEEEVFFDCFRRRLIVQHTQLSASWSTVRWTQVAIVCVVSSQYLHNMAV
jgi:hypothetical protein